MTASRQQLIQIMQRLYFGRIEYLHIRDGQPVFDPVPQLFRDRKLGSEDQPRTEWLKEDFWLKAQIIELFEEFDRISTGVITLIEIKHGLPFRMNFAEAI